MTTKLDKKQIKCAVFDLDGTLLNTIKTITLHINNSLSKYELPPISEKECMSFVGNGATKLIERTLSLVEADKSLFALVYKTYDDAYNAEPYYLTEPYDGIIELISSLKQRGIKLAVLSNKPDIAVKKAVNYFFPRIFDVALGGRDEVPLKPCPEALFEIMKELDVTPEQTVYIGDSEPDVLTAKNAGVGKAIFVTYGFRTREQLVSAGAEILVDKALKISELI